MEQTPEEYASGLGKLNKVGHNEVRFPCPCCNEDEGFSFNLKTGLWVCMRASCGERGNLFRMRVLRGEAYDVGGYVEPEKHADLVADFEGLGPGIHGNEDWRYALLHNPDAEAAREYLASRGLHADGAAATLAGLGWVRELPGQTNRQPRRRRIGPPPGGNGWITIPYRPVDTPPMVKLRAVPPELRDKNDKPIRYRRMAGGKTGLYSTCALNGRPVLVVGGELDALSVVQAYCDSGIDPSDIPVNVVAPTSETSTGVMAEALETVEGDVVVALDSDEAGQAAQERAASAIGRWRCRLARWPNGCKDANEALTSGHLDLFSLEEMVKSAEPAAGMGVSPTSAFEARVIARIRRQGATGWSTSWVSMDELLGGGLRPGETTVVTGHTGAGKSVWVSQVSNAMVAQGRKVFFCPFELGVEGQIERTLWQRFGCDPSKRTDFDIQTEMRSLGESFVWLDHYGAIAPSAFKETLLYVIRRLGADLVVIDHRDFMLKRGKKNRWDEADELVVEIIKAVQSSHAHCLLVVHPAKSSTTRKERDDWMPQLGDVKGHSDIYQDADNLVSIYRPRSADRAEAPDTDGCYQAAAVLLKVRSPRGREGTVEYRYDAKALRYLDPSQQGKLAWE